VMNRSSRARFFFLFFPFVFLYFFFFILAGSTIRHCDVPRNDKDDGPSADARKSK
jgi:hypothetical protein